MNILSIKKKLTQSNLFLAETSILNKPSIVGYEKKFKWRWFATQLNTFIVATDLGDTEITATIIADHLTESFQFSKDNYTGWPRGFQSGLGVVSVLISSTVTEEAKAYCEQLKSGKKWAGFTIPVVYDTTSNTLYKFQKNPIWGRIFYPHFKRLINSLV